MTRPWIVMLLLGAIGAAVLAVAILQSGARQTASSPSETTAETEIGDLPDVPLVGLPGDLAEGEPVSEEVARERNAARAFSTAPLVAAKPFRSEHLGEDRTRAVVCLAVAAVYEAGGRAEDQLPVMQVILNRVRHPAWPNSICEVVFQGSARQTGCQFTFTCDGSMQRWRPSAGVLEAAQTRAEAMLDGQVEKRVGLATHYHTDWVLPYWSARLDKITAVNSHIFFRWYGQWGSIEAFRGTPSSLEPQIIQLALFDETHLAQDMEVEGDDEPIALADAQIEDQDTGIAAMSAPQAAQTPAFPVIVLGLDPPDQPGRWSINAVAKCSGVPMCRVVGWADANSRPRQITPAALSANPPDFIYVQELPNRVRQAYWDCSRWAKAPNSQCIVGGAQASSLIY